MLNIREYARPQTLEEAYQLSTKKNSVILGGMLWLKMQNRSISTAIDLQDLGLDKIEKTENGYSIGAMVSLRELETSKELNDITGGALCDSVKHIVGIQFRNLATVGGSLWGRFGFSDVLTVFLALDAQVNLYKHGTVDIDTFSKMPTSEKDILLSVTIPSNCGKCVYLSQRNISTDFPVLTCAASRTDDGAIRCAVGARPSRAMLIDNVPSEISEAVEYICDRLTFGTNLRASEEYRRQICRVLVKRALEKLEVQ